MPRRSEASPRPLRGKEEAARSFYCCSVRLQSALLGILVRLARIERSASIVGVASLQVSNDISATSQCRECGTDGDQPEGHEQDLVVPVPERLED